MTWACWRAIKKEQVQLKELVVYYDKKMCVHLPGKDKGEAKRGYPGDVVIADEAEAALSLVTAVSKSSSRSLVNVFLLDTAGLSIPTGTYIKYKLMDFVYQKALIRTFNTSFLFTQ